MSAYHLAQGPSRLLRLPLHLLDLDLRAVSTPVSKVAHPCPSPDAPQRIWIRQCLCLSGHGVRDRRWEQHAAPRITRITPMHDGGHNRREAWTPQARHHRDPTNSCRIWETTCRTSAGVSDESWGNAFRLPAMSRNSRVAASRLDSPMCPHDEWIIIMLVSNLRFNSRSAS